MMKLISIILFLIVFFPECQPQSRYRIMFYNVENLFDTRNDSLTSDDDFTPAGALHWTKSRLSGKINRISKVIIAAGEWQPPAIIGLCEIENRQVLNQLLYNSPISAYGYKVVHFDSPDERGIDVSMIYDPEQVRIKTTLAIPVQKEKLLTRDILYCNTIIGNENIHIFINHWPSRSAGQLETEGLRIYAADILKNFTDSIIGKDSRAKILIMGDFNDEPFDVSISEVLGAQEANGQVQRNLLYNLASPPRGSVKGTLKYQGTWNIFDQIMVSGNLIADVDGLKVDPEGYTIFHTPQMLETDETYNGVKPFRTYLGYRYHGGFSDHLPVFIDLVN